jgi:peptidoglycan hydrolase-like protein with peptidoglycan-binding domain
VVVVLVAMLAVTAGVAAASGFGLPDRGGHPQAHSDLPPATAKVTRQTLVDTQTEDGELGHGDTTTVSARLAGTVTALPAVGATVERGEALYRVDNTPVVLLYGTLPAYRALSPGTKGDDVKQFEQNLYALGYRGFTVDSTYSETTADAVKKWQGDLGLPKTGTVELGRVSYAAGAVRVEAQKLAVGDASQPGAEVLSHTGTARVVTVKLAVSDQRLATVGATVSAKLPDGKTIPGKITRTQTVIQPAEGQNPATTKIQVTVSFADGTALAGLDEATVQVGFTASRRANVLTVPVAALLALAEGGYGVQVVDGSSSRIVAVQTGLFASGRVEVSGDGLAEGTTVGMPA